MTWPPKSVERIIRERAAARAEREQTPPARPKRRRRKRKEPAVSKASRKRKRSRAPRPRPGRPPGAPNKPRMTIHRSREACPSCGNTDLPRGTLAHILPADVQADAMLKHTEWRHLTCPCGQFLTVIERHVVENGK